MSSQLIPIEAPSGERSMVSALGLHRTTVLREIKTGRLKTVKVGRRRFTTDELLAEYVASLPVHGGDAA
ncbi:helix-turn-helix domain-containing protein [Gordonia sp. PP30]|uniref:helix-turn-helix domain-containing protein n=1 Tax=Gordonia sp. PP30 TaxID=2935861 RepID=UPI001FFEA978|nr:helix-turn-helix domain-containing protein [Gordonia sp. PP30]UQE74704.1 helix-turn-helix domain-containing protein [Gordonia sp. PP30]